MARIDIKSAGGAALNDGVLQLENGVAMDATLRKVTDQNNTASPLLLSTTAVQVTSPLRITTSDASGFYLDAEDSATNNRFSIKRDPSAQEVTLDFASNPAGSTTTVGAIRTYGDGVNLSNAVTFREDGQVTFTERVNVEADSLVTTQSSSVIAATTTNANLVIAPNGTGALIADIPDGTATGGNARGNNSVDLQTSRSSADRVASGNLSTIVGGTNNRAYGVGVFVGGGSGNVAGGNDNYQTIVGGNSNTIVAAGGSFIGGGLSNTVSNGSGSGYCVINGGQSNLSNGGTHNTIGGGLSNTVSSTYSTVSGGQSNTASTGSHATVIGGQSNVSSGQNSVSGGSGNSASAARSVAFGGSNNAQAEASISLGQQNVSNNSFSFSSGYFALSYLYGQASRQNGRFNSTGDAQQSNLTARREATLTTGGTTVLSLDGTGTTNLIIPTGVDRMWNVQVRWVAVVTTITGTATGVTVGDTKTSTDLLAVAKRGGVTTVSAHTSAGTHVIETTAGSLTAANITYSAGASQEMAITFTGPTFAGGGSVTMRIVAAISLTEVAF